MQASRSPDRAAALQGKEGMKKEGSGEQGAEGGAGETQCQGVDSRKGT